MTMEVEFFDSLEAAQARLRQAMEAADTRVKPWQAAVAPGDCFVADGDEEGLLVFGEVLEGYTEAHLRHYRFCRCFSVACPEGEVGDVHVSTVLYVIARGVFELARQHGWDLEEGQQPPSARRPDDGEEGDRRDREIVGSRGAGAWPGARRQPSVEPAPALVQLEPPRQITRAHGSAHNSRLRSSTADARRSNRD
jgi:hypothetical protein